MQPTPIKHQPIGIYHSREREWLKQYSETHMNLPAISRKFSIGKDKLLLILPRPDKRSPYGNRTRLWRRDMIKTVLGEPR